MGNFDLELDLLITPTPLVLIIGLLDLVLNYGNKDPIMASRRRRKANPQSRWASHVTLEDFFFLIWFLALCKVAYFGWITREFLDAPPLFLSERTK